MIGLRISWQAGARGVRWSIVKEGITNIDPILDETVTKLLKQFTTEFTGLHILF